MKGTLLLEDGTRIEGSHFGYEGSVLGEIVFNTGMTGYQEILTDPSYAGQVVTMTYPLVGNYGINANDFESHKSQVQGFIVKDYCQAPNHYEMTMTLEEYMKKEKIIGLADVDTRMITKAIRNHGTMLCLLTSEEVTDDHVEALKNYRFPRDIVEQVSIKKKTIHKKEGRLALALVDLGIKKGIIKQLEAGGCQVTLYPHDVAFNDLMKDAPDLLFLSNGPGDPKDCQPAIDLVKQARGHLPIRGICLGHQVIALALGADTYKLKFGHRGANHPVINTLSQKVMMTSQNHGYAVDLESIPDQVEVTYLNVNDETVEGICSDQEDIQCVQFHPEEGPGPTDAHQILSDWIGGAYALK